MESSNNQNDLLNSELEDQIVSSKQELAQRKKSLFDQRMQILKSQGNPDWENNQQTSSKSDFTLPDFETMSAKDMIQWWRKDIQPRKNK